jgi:polysaccharide deacetylase 2 family uncharacterized protein YibQ
MKSTKKAPVKPKTAPKTTAKKSRSLVRRRIRKKPLSADAFRAVLLAGVLIAVSGLISMAVIIVHSTLKDTVPGGIGGKTTAERPVPLNPSPLPPLEQPAPASAAPAKPTERPAPVSAAPVKPAERPAPASAASVKPAERPAPASAVPVKPAERPAPASAAPVKPAERPAPASAAPVKPADRPAPASAVPETRPAARPERPGPERRGTLVFVIDDAGNNLTELEPFLRFPGPLTIAVLPGLPHSAEAARRIRAAGKEVFLHQPMEAVGGQPPGPGAIYTGMSAAEIRAVLARNVAEIGPIAGMNNHQGSKITMDREAMETVLSFCREEGIYFLDSKTIAGSAAPAAARSLGIKIGERDIFIDNEQNRDSMIRYINEGMTRSERRGSAVMIGHTWSPELAPILTGLYPELINQGYSLGTASTLISGRTE